MLLLSFITPLLHDLESPDDEVTLTKVFKKYSFKLKADYFRLGRYFVSCFNLVNEYFPPDECGNMTQTQP